MTIEKRETVILSKAEMNALTIVNRIATGLVHNATCPALKSRADDLFVVLMGLEDFIQEE